MTMEFSSKEIKKLSSKELKNAPIVAVFKESVTYQGQAISEDVMKEGLKKSTISLLELIEDKE